MSIKTFTLPKHQDDRFTLIPLELKDQIDFEVKRVYALVDGQKPSGSHCHKIEQECFICFKGGVTAVVDDGSGLTDIKLTQGQGLVVPAYVWHHFKDFLPSSVIVALSSTNYSAERDDYINDYEEFKKQVNYVV